MVSANVRMRLRTNKQAAVVVRKMRPRVKFQQVLDD